MNILIKDDILISGEGAAAGNKMLKSFISPYSATAVEKLQKAGFKTVRFGESNAVLSSSINTTLKGVFQFKPTYGRFSRYGLIANASSFDQICVSAEKLDDCLKISNVISGFDENDMTSIESTEIHPAKTNVCTKVFNSNGFELCEAANYIVATADLAGNLGRFDGVRYGHRSSAAKDVNDVYLLSRSEGFDKETKVKLIAGTHIICSGVYVKAKQVIKKLKDEFYILFNECDVLVSEKDNLLMLAETFGLPFIILPNGKQLVAKERQEDQLFAAAAKLSEGGTK